MNSKKSKKSKAPSDDDLLKETKYMKLPFKSPAGEIFDNSESSDDDYVAPLKTHEEDDDPFPITISRRNKEDKRKTDFTMVNAPQYKLYVGSFVKYLPMFQEPFLGLPLPTYFDQQKNEGVPRAL